MIPIKNIYYMLSYAFKELKSNGFKNIETEDFNNVYDLYASILIKALTYQIKNGLNKDYLQYSEGLSTVKGKINLNDTFKQQSLLKRKLVCDYDDFSIDNNLNRIIKASLQLLLKADIEKDRKKEIRKLLVFLKDISDIDVYNINWRLHFTRSTHNYQFLITICQFIVKGLLQSTDNGNTRTEDFLESNLPRLYEKFILEYYKKEYPGLSVSASQINWQLDDKNDFMLPLMQSDIMISNKNKILIIDAKYYSRIFSQRFDVSTINSNNLYQIFTYVKNKSIEKANTNFEISGMLLYAKTDEEISPNNTYRMSGNKISVNNLDLNCDFDHIKIQLNKIINDYFQLGSYFHDSFYVSREKHS